MRVIRFLDRKKRDFVYDRLKENLKQPIYKVEQESFYEIRIETNEVSIADIKDLVSLYEGQIV